MSLFRVVPRPVLPRTAPVFGGVVRAYTWTDADMRALVRAAAELGTTGAELSKVLWGESGGNPSAYNGSLENPNALGLNQITPVNANAMGLSRAEWLYLPAMTAEEQLPYVVRSFRAAVGSRPLPDATALYVANFAPAYVSHAGDDSFVLYPAGHPAVKANPVLDHGKKGFITVGDMRIYANRVSSSPAYKAHVARLQAFESAPPAPVGAGSPASGTGGSGTGLVVALVVPLAAVGLARALL